MHVRGKFCHGAAEVDNAAHHADTRTVTHDGRQGLAVAATDNGAAAAHEFKGKAARALKNPELRIFVQRILLHEGSGTGARAAAYVNGTAGGAVPGRVTGVTGNRDAATGVQPAHVGRSRALDDYLGIGQGHAAYPLPRVGHGKGQLLALFVPEGTADVVLSGRINVEIRLTLVHRFLDGKQQILGGHTCMIVQCMDGQHKESPCSSGISTHTGCRACQPQPDQS